MQDLKSSREFRGEPIFIRSRPHYLINLFEKPIDNRLRESVYNWASKKSFGGGEMIFVPGSCSIETS